MTTNNTVVIEKKELQLIIDHLDAAAKKVYHINNALFNEKYKTTLNFNNIHDAKNIQITLILANASLNREIQELEKIMSNKQEINNDN